jgi:nicotinate-nucleotide adenylyltransferase
MRIGLFGGTFAPAHAGHAHVAHVAAARLGLHKVWWLVTPQNPLKPRAPALEHRMASARKQGRGRRMVVTDFESRLGLTYSIDTVNALRRLYPGAKFALIMGADNLSNFAKWQRWPELVRAIPIAVISRPDCGPRGRFAKPFARFAAARRAGARTLADQTPPAWMFLPARFSPLSSTALRSRQG